MSWLKLFVSINIEFILKTFEVSQFPILALPLLLNVVGVMLDRLLNMLDIFVTCEVSHDPMSWLNAEAPANILPISVTCEVSHDPMSWLNAIAKENI